MNIYYKCHCLTESNPGIKTSSYFLNCLKVQYTIYIALVYFQSFFCKIHVFLPWGVIIPHTQNDAPVTGNEVNFYRCSEHHLRKIFYSLCIKSTKS